MGASYGVPFASDRCLAVEACIKRKQDRADPASCLVPSPFSTINTGVHIFYATADVCVSLHVFICLKTVVLKYHCSENSLIHYLVSFIMPSFFLTGCA